MFFVLVAGPLVALFPCNLDGISALSFLSDDVYTLASREVSWRVGMRAVTRGCTPQYLPSRACVFC